MTSVLDKCRDIASFVDRYIVESVVPSPRKRAFVLELTEIEDMFDILRIILKFTPASQLESHQFLKQKINYPPVTENTSSGPNLNILLFVYVDKLEFAEIF